MSMDEMKMLSSVQSMDDLMAMMDMDIEVIKDDSKGY